MKLPKNTEDAAVERVIKWRQNSLIWFSDVFGDNIRKLRKCNTDTGLSSQQEEAFLELDKLINAKVKAAKGDHLTEREKEYSKKIGLSIMSGTGTGKDFFTALVIFSFLHRFPYPRIVATANTQKQLQNVLWSELSKVSRLSIDAGNGIPVLDDMFEIQTEKAFCKAVAKEKRGKEWFAEAVTINTKASEEEQGEALGGRHADYMLVVVDEASGIPDAVFKPLEGTLTGICNIVLMIFNPTRSKGFAKESQYGDSKRWISLRWDSEKSELVSRDFIESMAERYGDESNAYRIRVSGLPPLNETDTLILGDWIEDAVVREFIPQLDDPVILGVDCGAGGDKSIIAIRQGGQIAKLLKYSTSDTMILVGHIVRTIEDTGANAVFVDNIGIGLGVYNRLCELGYSRIVHPADVRAGAMNPERFYRRRDELWWTLRDQFEKGIISIPNDADLKDQLNSICSAPMESSGKIKVDTKKTLKSKIGHSSDEADAIVLTYYRPDYFFRHVRDEEKDKKSQYDASRGYVTQAWMGA